MKYFLLVALLLLNALPGYGMHRALSSEELSQIYTEFPTQRLSHIDDVAPMCTEVAVKCHRQPPFIGAENRLRILLFEDPKDGALVGLLSEFISSETGWNLRDFG